MLLQMTIYNIGVWWILPIPLKGYFRQSVASLARANHAVLLFTAAVHTAKGTDNKSVPFAGGRWWIRTTEVGDVRFTV